MATEIREARLLARALERLGSDALRAFWSDLAKARKGLLEDISGVVVSLTRNRGPRRIYREFMAEVRKKARR